MKSALNATIDIYNYSHVNNHKARDKLLEIIKDLQKVHYYWILYSENKVSIWKKKLLKLSRLDYILISESLSNFAFVKDFLKAKLHVRYSAVILEMKCTVILLEDMVSGS